VCCVIGHRERKKKRVCLWKLNPNPFYKEKEKVEACHGMEK